jgi:hypothetical protein
MLRKTDILGCHLAIRPKFVDDSAIWQAHAYHGDNSHLPIKQPKVCETDELNVDRRDLGYGDRCRYPYI